MREILFRGKAKANDCCKDGGYWVEGDIVHLAGMTCIHNGLDTIEVDPETVGQFTGLYDKNDNKIFEGDIVQLHYFYEAHDPSTLGAYEAEENIVATINIWDMGVGFDQVGGNLYGYLHDWLESPQDELEIIGNKWDNPEFLRGEE